MGKLLNPNEYIEVVEQIKTVLADYDARNAKAAHPHAQGNNAIAAFDIIQSLIQASDRLTLPKPTQQGKKPKPERPDEAHRAARRVAAKASAALDEEAQRLTVQVFKGLPHPGSTT